MIQIITNDDISSYTGWELSQQEKIEVDRICQSVSNMFEKATGRTYSADADDAVTEHLTLQQPVTQIFLRNTPATEITSIETLDLGSSPASYEAVGVVYHLIAGYKIMLSGAISGQIKIVYKGATAPNDVKQALIEWALLLWGARFDDGKIASKENIGVTNKEYMVVDNLPANIQQVIDQHKIYDV